MQKTIARRILPCAERVHPRRLLSSCRIGMPSAPAADRRSEHPGARVSVACGCIGRVCTTGVRWW